MCRLSTELGNRGREDHAHEESREGLRKMFQERRLQPPARPQSFRVIRQVIVGQAEDLPKIDHESLTIVLWGGGDASKCRPSMRPFRTSFQRPLRAKAGLTASNSARGKGAASHQPDLPLLQVADLRDNDQVALISPDFVRLAHDRQSRADDRD
jgi:hypothetical protein